MRQKLRRENKGSQKFRFFLSERNLDYLLKKNEIQIIQIFFKLNWSKKLKEKKSAYPLLENENKVKKKIFKKSGKNQVAQTERGKNKSRTRIKRVRWGK